jgi:eukaryotic-like serine/threonine-protein kinase
MVLSIGVVESTTTALSTVLFGGSLLPPPHATSNNANQAERTIATDYYLLVPPLSLGRTLGRGAFGAVYEAEDSERGDIAVKVVPWRDDLAERLASAVVHPNLLRLYEVRRENDTALVLMERIDGTLLLPQVRPRPERKAGRPTLPLAFGQPLQEGGLSAFAPIDDRGVSILVPALRDLAAALHAMHRAGKVHRDVRPENVMLTRDGRVVLIDFGLVVSPGERGSHTEIAGAPAYMAPDEAPTAASDWYSFGVLIFEALTGALPFAGTAQEVIVRKQTVSAPSPSFVVNLPPSAKALDELCVRLLRRVPSLRPSFEEIVAGLQ